MRSEFHCGTIFDAQSRLISCDKIVIAVCLNKQTMLYENWICRYPSDSKETKWRAVMNLFDEQVGKEWDFAVRLDESNRLIEFL